MKVREICKFLVMVLLLCSLSHAADLLIEDFESYSNTAELRSVWVERNPTVVNLGLETLEAKDGTKSMIFDYNCHASPFWSEAYTIFPSAQEWSAYKTLNVWVKGYIGDVPGRDPNQSNENMYTVFYKAKPGYENPIDNSQLDMIGKVTVYRATKIADWTILHFCLGANFEPLTEVRAIGIGMSPDSYGIGIVKLDSISLTEESYGGIINSFEEYADTAALRAALDVNEGNSVSSSMTLVTAAEDANALNGKTLKFEFDNGMSPNWAKVMFTLPKTIKYAWGPPSFNYGMNYNPLTINFKVVDPEGRLQVVLIGSNYQPTATYRYNNGARITAGDWIRWDIDPQTVYETSEFLTELDAVIRVEVQFIPIDGYDYGTGLVYLDDIHVNFCGEGVGSPPVGYLRADFNDDCVIDFRDMVTFAEEWGKSNCISPSYCNGADFSIYGSRNGKVDFADLDVVVYTWLDCNFLYQGDCF